MSGLPQQPSIFGGETHRLSALTDGVFSIVMTLMVFNISLPKDRPSGNLTMALLGLWASFLAYGISFGLVGIYWSAHHSMFRFIQRTSHELVWLNIVFLAFVALVPFSTTLLAAHHSEPVALIVYGGNLILIGLSLLPLWWHATVGGRLVQRDLPVAVVRYGKSRILVGIIGYGLATVLALHLKNKRMERRSHAHAMDESPVWRISHGQATCQRRTLATHRTALASTQASSLPVPLCMPLDYRKVLTGIIFVLKTGILWEELPQEMGCGCGMTCLNYLNAWQRAGVWEKLHQILLAELEQADKLDWSRAAVDSAKARALGGGDQTGPYPTDRGKPGTYTMS